MKKRNVFLAIGGLVVVIGVAAALLFTQNSATKAFSANMLGTEEVPPVVSAASGSATFTLSPDGASMTFVVNVTNMTNITASHIHIAAAGINGPVAVPLFGGAMAGPLTGVLAQGTITAANLGGPLLGMTINDLVLAMQNGNAYVNVHTTQHPGGEIRGQIHLAP